MRAASEEERRAFGRGLGRYMHERRIEAGIPIEDAAAIVGYWPGRLRTFERDAGKMGLPQYLHLCTEYGVPQEVLMRDINEIYLASLATGDTTAVVTLET